jgi:hypothetical protein
MEEHNEEKDGAVEEGATETVQETAPASEAEVSATASARPERRRQEKVGLVTSDKMQKTVVVRVERQEIQTIYSPPQKVHGTR